MMKKFGFTLAEVLITLSIIGVVAAISLPGLIKASRQDIYASRLATTVQTIENGMNNAIIAEVRPDLLQTSVWSIGASGVNPENNIRQQFTGNLSRYLIISGYKNKGETVYNGRSLFQLSNGGGKGTAFVEANWGIPIILKNGAVVSIETRTNGTLLSDADAAVRGTSLKRVAAVVHIDVNGMSSPNIIGRDLFLFYLGDNGVLYPEGGKDITAYNLNANPNGAVGDWSDATNSSACTDALKSNSGWGCTARLIAHNYKMDY